MNGGCRDPMGTWLSWWISISSPASSPPAERLVNHDAKLLKKLYGMAQSDARAVEPSSGDQILCSGLWTLAWK
jgi:hypothetical protein